MQFDERFGIRDETSLIHRRQLLRTFFDQLIHQRTQLVTMALLDGSIGQESEVEGADTRICHIANFTHACQPGFLGGFHDDQVFLEQLDDSWLLILFRRQEQAQTSGRRSHGGTAREH